LNAFRERGTGNGEREKREREKREREKRELLADKKYFWKYEMLPLSTYAPLAVNLPLRQTSGAAKIFVQIILHYCLYF
jgi:hypothetical protein